MTGIWNHAVLLFGTVVAAAALISFAVSCVERIVLSQKSRQKSFDKDAAGTVSEAGMEEKGGRRIAIITGASSGLGRGYARAIDRNPDRYDVNEIWLIARRQERLLKLAEELTLPVKIFPMDLTVSKNIEDFAEYLRGGHFRVTVLLNCAGFGKYGASADVGHEEECRMIDLNCKAAVSMTDIVVPYMAPGGRIGEVCSVAGFQPIAYFNMYSATKALLYTYSRSLRIELLKKGISVTAICPYWVKDTEFIENATGKKKKLPMASASKNVILMSLYDLRQRHAVSTPGLVCTLDRIFAGLIPDGVLGYLTSKFL